MKRMRFSDYVTIRLLFKSDACHEIRQSDWMLGAQNHHHFCRRIDLCAELIEYCFEPVRRIKIRLLLSL